MLLEFNPDWIIIFLCFMRNADKLSPVEPKYWTLTPGHHVTQYNNNSGHMTQLTNHSSPCDRVRVLTSDFGIAQTFPTNYVADECFAGSWGDPAAAPSRPLHADEYQVTANQLPVSFDDITARQRVDFYDHGGGELYHPADSITWTFDGPRPEYGRNSISGVSSASSFGTYQMTYNTSSSLTVYPTSPSPWLYGQQMPRNRACADYRMSRHHVVSDVTPGQCGWPGACEFDDMMWHGKFVNPLEGV